MIANQNHHFFLSHVPFALCHVWKSKLALTFLIHKVPWKEKKKFCWPKMLLEFSSNLSLLLWSWNAKKPRWYWPKFNKTVADELQEERQFANEWPYSEPTTSKCFMRSKNSAGRVREVNRCCCPGGKGGMGRAGEGKSCTPPRACQFWSKSTPAAPDHHRPLGKRARIHHVRVDHFVVLPKILKT